MPTDIIDALRDAKRVLAARPAPDVMIAPDEGALELALVRLVEAVGKLPSPSNLNVNVRRAKESEHGAVYVVEFSYDGAAFTPQMFFYQEDDHPNANDVFARARRSAEDWARTYVLGYKAAGGRVLNATSHGYAL